MLAKFRIPFLKLFFEIRNGRNVQFSLFHLQDAVIAWYGVLCSDSFCMPSGHPRSRPNRLLSLGFRFTEFVVDVALKSRDVAFSRPLHTCVYACMRACAPTVSIAPDSFCMSSGRPRNRPNRLLSLEFSVTDVVTDVALEIAISAFFCPYATRPKTPQTECAHSPNRPYDLACGLAHLLYIPWGAHE